MDANKKTYVPLVYMIFSLFKFSYLSTLNSFLLPNKLLANTIMNLFHQILCILAEYCTSWLFD
jgi:hypothetical protein